MKKIVTVDGNEACSRASYLFTELAGVYPITPSSPMAEYIDEWSRLGLKNIFGNQIKIIEMQSEAGVAGLIHGSLQSGVLSSTYTASQGLLLMIPNMYKMAGEMLPSVIHVAARSLSTHALSIFGDHQDIYATRSTGFAMMASSNVQDAYYLSAISHLSAIEGSIPFLHFFDGFRTSHELNKIEVLDKDDYNDIINYEAITKFRKKSLQPLHPVIRGTNQNDDIYFQMMEVRNKFYDKLPDIVNKYMEKINKKANTDYAPFVYYGNPSAKKVIIAMGSICDTIKETIDYLDGEIGLIEVHLYRPFSEKYLLKVLPKSVEKVAVLDRTKEHGSNGEPLYLDVANILKDKLDVVGGRYGLSSKNTTPAHIKAVYDMLDDPKNNFTIGIVDDVTNLSLPIDKNFKIENSEEILIYGYGSDGMISAGKSLIGMIGSLTDKYVQGYFEYDSKKSGGVTVGHLRFRDERIRKPYYVETPKMIVITKDSYLSEFDLLDNIKENGICLIATSRTKEELIKIISNNNLKILKEKNITIHIIDAFKIADENNIKNKISMIMEEAISSILSMVDKNEADEYLKKYIKNKFSKKGDEIVNSNIKAMESVIENIKTFKINENVEIKQEFLDTYEMIKHRKGNELKVSAFLDFPDGTFLKTEEKQRGISNYVPKWLSKNCISCNQCSFVCPHSVIRPYLISKEEYEKAPDYVKNRAIKSINPKFSDYYYLIAIAIKNCTGCGICINSCPGMKGNKTLEFSLLDKEIEAKEQEIFDYVDKFITNKKIMSDQTVIGSQFEKPSFAFCSACAGCGETAYIKILTQLFKDQIMIANATGCSSIYGGSVPAFPYSLPWASSLFEDNAEYGYGMLMGNKVIDNYIINIIEENKGHKSYSILQKWIQNRDNYEECKKILGELENIGLPEKLVELKEYLLPKKIWTVGGDGWAYDIGFGGIDQVASSGEDVNILVLDTQVYSNTGGQSSKASPEGAVLSFAVNGKTQTKKDLARMLLSYPNVYIATVSLGANMMQLLKVFKEADAYKGPSIIIAYTPCISHGIEGGMENSVVMEKLAAECGYFPLFHYHPETGKLILDSKEPNFDLYEDFLKKQNRFNRLYKVNSKEAEKLLKINKENAIKRYEYYKMLSEKI